MAPDATARQEQPGDSGLRDVCILEGERRPTKPVGLRVGICCTRDNSRSSKETGLRAAFMSNQKAIAISPEDMTLSENVELGDSGPCRRR